MKNYFYNTSDELTNLLTKFEQLSQQIILLPINPKMEIKLQMEANINRMYHTLRLAEIDIRRNKIIEILARQSHLTRYERMILDMKTYFEEFYYNWKYNKRPLDTSIIVNLIFSIEKKRITLNTTEISGYLSYIQLEQSPIIQAALAYLIFIEELNNPVGSIVGTLVAWLLLFKQGYDFRRIFSFQRQFINDRINYHEILEKVKKQENITDWIHYFCQSFINGVESEIPFIKDQLNLPSLERNILSSRHIRILSLLSSPDDTISNRMVQQKFKISQITASRDLSYLTSLGLLFSLGKGRSTIYTKV